MCFILLFFLEMNISAKKKKKSRQNNVLYNPSLSVCVFVCFLLIKFEELIKNPDGEIMMTAPDFS